MIGKHGGSFRVESKFQWRAARRCESAAQTLLLLKPVTYMNRSGEAVQALAQFSQARA